MRIYVIRHGQTDWNAEKRLQGRSETALNEKGRTLARITGEALRAIPFACAFTSPLGRAAETARLVLGGRDIPVIMDGRLIEISFGEYEGMCFSPEKYASLNPDEVKPVPDPDFLNFFHHPERYRTPPGGESLDSVEERAAAFIRDICTRPELEDKTVLVSTHGCAMRGLMNSLRNAPRAEYWGMSLAPNCGVSLIESHNGRARIVWENRVFYEICP